MEEDGEVIGYGAVEEAGDDPGWFRIFVVLPNERLQTPVAEQLHDRLWSDPASFSAAGAWFREDAKLEEVIQFFEAHGYEETRRYSAGGPMMVVMKKPILDRLTKGVMSN